MFPLEADRFRGEIILIARILLVILFVISGWGKLTNYGWAVSYMATTGAPAPQIAAVLAIAIELFVGIAILLGIFTRPLALLMALFTLVAAFIGHRYWTMTGADQYFNEMHFYKNVSIVGGFLLLYSTGAGKYSLDTALGRISRGGLPIASATASMSPRSEHRLPSDNSAKIHRPGLIGSAELMMDKWLKYPGRLYNRR
jgi:putative oxidoreductase